ncbi:transcriptional regulator [Mycobacterium sp. 852002-51057_SCH5723018]|nr:transcriptional regulator [Mycobacterium sp. 852002-51057_SCH5723018]
MNGLVPTGTVTLLLADVEASTRLWDSVPGEMTAAIAALDHTLSELTAVHRGVRPIEQGEGDSFVVAFARPSDAIACALELQRAALAPIRLRIGVHTGEVQLRDEANYIGTTINRAGRLRELAHGGQTVLSGTTADLVIDRLPADTWLTDLGRHYLRGLTRPERVVQLCHPDLHNQFPPLRMASGAVAHNLPLQLSSFIGRVEELSNLRRLLASNRLVTLTGAGGIGKTRLAQQLSARPGTEFGDGVWYVDLAPIGSAELVASTVARTLGLGDQPGRPAIDKLIHLIGGRHMVIVLDNCEHLLDACAALAGALLAGCPRLTLLDTSREPLGMPGEVIWRVSSLPIADDAVELFADRARLARPDFRITDDNVGTVTEICQRLDGMPLAIELAAARVRTLSLAEILDGLRDRFCLLTGGARTAAVRQQTLRASVCWSHALLTEPERVLFRRLAVFAGGFDLDAAQVVAGCDELEDQNVGELLSLLVDKSLALAEDHRGRTRYRLLETARQYAQEKLDDAGEEETIRTRHCGHYTSVAAMFDTVTPAELERHAERAEIEIDNLRAAFGWAVDRADAEAALALASFLQPLWWRRGMVREGGAWYDVALECADAMGAHVASAARVRALADRAMLTAAVGDPGSEDAVAEALALAREIGEPALLLRALSAWCAASAYDPRADEESFAETINLARSQQDMTTLSQLLHFQAWAALRRGDPMAMRLAAEEGRDIARAIGDPFSARRCDFQVGMSQLFSGDLDGALQRFDEVIADADAYRDPIFGMGGRFGRTMVLAFQGQTTAASVTAAAVVEQAAELSDSLSGFAYAGLALAALAAGDVAGAAKASEIVRLCIRRELLSVYWNPVPEIALARGDLAAARGAADDAVAMTTGSHAMALTTRARIAAAQGEFEQAEHDAHAVLTCAATMNASLGVPAVLDCLAGVAGQLGSYRRAARLFGCAQGARDRTGLVRFRIYEPAYQASLKAVREALGDTDFEAIWAQGAAMSTAEAIAYAQRGHGKRKRPSSGWASLTPAEREVVRLVGDGLSNKDVAAKLFVSPRTVQTHLTRIFRKLGISSRVQLAQEAARHP